VQLATPDFSPSRVHDATGRQVRVTIRTSDTQRMMTALIYLNDDYQGRETPFVKTWLRVKRRKGDALICRSVRPMFRSIPSPNMLDRP
jgi:hypothetical protein